MICPYCKSADVELVPVADGAKFDVRPQFKDGSIKIYSGKRLIRDIEDLIAVAKENALYPYAYCHKCTAEFDAINPKYQYKFEE